MKIIDDGEPRDVHIKEGDIFLLPSRVPHSPQRPAGTVGLVIETKRPESMIDALQWYCENCGMPLYAENFHVKNIETDMPVIFDKYYNDENLTTCDNCGHKMEKTAAIVAD